MSFKINDHFFIYRNTIFLLTAKLLDTFHDDANILMANSVLFIKKSNNETNVKLPSENKKIYLIDCTLLAFVMLLFFSDTLHSEFWWSDESRHAMDGVFFYDFFRDLPLTNLMSFLEEYIVRFPAISFTWNLPFFAIISAPFYALFGVSAFTAQMVGLFFACTLSISMFHWSKEFTNPFSAGIVVVLFFLNEHVVLWMRSVMLEIPALTMMFLLSLAFKKHTQHPTYRYALFTGLIGFSMLMTKQITLFMLPLLVIYAWYRNRLPILWDKRSIPAYFFIILGISIVILHALTIGKSGVSRLSNSSLSIVQLLYHVRLPLMLRTIYTFFPLPILILALIGATTGFKAGDSRKIFFLISWLFISIFFLAYLTGSKGNALRYCIYIAPPIYLLALSTFDYIRRYSIQYYMFFGLITSILVWQASIAFQLKQPYLRGYADIAKFVYDLPENRPVLFCCDHDGNYIFSMRALDKDRRSITLRADKLLVTIIISPLRGVTSHTRNTQQIMDLLDKYGVGLLVIEENTYTEVKEFQMLREVVRSNQFEKLKSFTTSAGDGSYSGRGTNDNTVVNIYRYKNAKPIKNGKISIPLPRFNRVAVLEVN